MPNKRGFTLMEVLIAVTIFATLTSISAAFFINITKTERKTELLNAMYEDSRVIMEMISREIRNGTVDYEEYYSINVLGATHYGINRGVYASRFYNPGFTIKDAGEEVMGTNPANLGVECVLFDGKNTVLDKNCDNPAAEVYTLSVDQDFGKNPFGETDTEVANASAFCDINGCAGNPNLNATELYLISSDGRTKTIIGRKVLSDAIGDSILGMVQMDAKDMDGNGITDVFVCKEEFGCSTAVSADSDIGKLPEVIKSQSLLLPKTTDLSDAEPKYQPFIPLSPLRSSIKNLKFIVWPVEDPYRAFAEPATQYQPSVTIIITMEPSAAEKLKYPGDAPSVTVQTTVSAGAKNKIQTYPPTKDLSWITTELLNPTP